MDDQSVRRRVLILYGSETGQSEAISQQIHDQCDHHLEVLTDNFNISVERLCLDTIGDKYSLETEQTVVFVVSTTGEGEPPQNALKFYRKYRKRALPKSLLSHLRYCLLALGDTNYERFANFGKDLGLIAVHDFH
jgi:methionine synthase reductase